MPKALTRGRIARVASDHGWERDCQALRDRYTKDGDVVNAHFDNGGRLSLAEYWPAGQRWSFQPKHNKLAFVRGWLAGEVTR